MQAGTGARGLLRIRAMLGVVLLFGDFGHGALSWGSGAEADEHSSPEGLRTGALPPLLSHLKSKAPLFPPRWTRKLYSPAPLPHPGEFFEG